MGTCTHIHRLPPHHINKIKENNFLKERVNTYIYVITTHEKEALNLKYSEEGNVGGLKRGEDRKKCN